MKDNNCIFCKLANGEIPTATIYEDEDFRVILDANPAAKGHALILPKEHYANLYELDDELAGKSMILAKKMITKLTKALDCDGYNIVQNNGEAAGQTVFHYHVHMIPRHKDDKVGLGWTMHELTEEEKEDRMKYRNLYMTKFRANFKNHLDSIKVKYVDENGNEIKGN